MLVRSPALRRLQLMCCSFHGLSRLKVANAFFMVDQWFMRIKLRGIIRATPVRWRTGRPALCPTVNSSASRRSHAVDQRCLRFPASPSAVVLKCLSRRKVLSRSHGLDCLYGSAHPGAICHHHHTHTCTSICPPHRSVQLLP